MKNKILTLFFVSLIALFLSNCGGGGTNNEYLGKIPSLTKQYYNEIEEKEKDLKKCTDMNDAFKLGKELKLLEEEEKTKMKEYVSANSFNKPLPFKALDSSAYTIKKITINNASNLNIKFSVTINEDIKNKWGGIEKNLFLYYKALDSQGKDIENSKTVAANFARKELKAGLEYEVFGSWSTNAIINMEDFAKVVQITKEEYNGK